MSFDIIRAAGANAFEMASKPKRDPLVTVFDAIDFLPRFKSALSKR